MVLISQILYFNQQHEVFSTIFFVLIGIILAVTRKKSSLGVIFFVFGFLNFMFGSVTNHKFVFKNGVPATGVVTEIQKSNVTVNKQPQKDFKVLIKIPNGQVVSSSFSSYHDVFETNLNSDSLQEPLVGEEFAVLSIPGHEKNFIILADDEKSPYGKRITCGTRLKNLEKAQAEAKFSPQDPALQRRLTEAEKAYQDLGCQLKL